MAKKGLKVLITAIPKVLKHVVDAKFVFVGGGNTCYYEKMLCSRGIPKENFEFIGHVGYFDRPRILREANVFVNPSFFENCSISILEAMSCGSAVIASNVGGNPELIQSGKNGLLVYPNDPGDLAESIVSLLKSENLNRSLGAQARRTVEDSFTSEKCASKTFEVYKQMVREHLCF